MSKIKLYFRGHVYVLRKESEVVGFCAHRQAQARSEHELKKCECGSKVYKKIGAILLYVKIRYTHIHRNFYKLQWQRGPYKSAQIAASVPQ